MPAPKRPYAEGIFFRVPCRWRLTGRELGRPEPARPAAILGYFFIGAFHQPPTRGEPGRSCLMTKVILVNHFRLHRADERIPGPVIFLGHCRAGVRGGELPSPTSVANPAQKPEVQTHCILLPRHNTTTTTQPCGSGEIRISGGEFDDFQKMGERDTADRGRLRRSWMKQRQAGREVRGRLQVVGQAPKAAFLARPASPPSYSPPPVSAMASNSAPTASNRLFVDGP